MPEHEVIHPDSELGNKMGFTEELFGGYLCLQDNTVWVSAILSKNPGKHNLTKLFNQIHNLGYQIKVPQPFPRMEAIVKAKGFLKTTERWEEMGATIDVWVKHAR